MGWVGMRKSKKYWNVQIYTKNSCLQNPTSGVWIGEWISSSKFIFDRNSMKYPDLHKKIMHGPIPVDWVQGRDLILKKFLLGIK